MSKITKEELIMKNAELKHDLELEQLKDQHIRRQFLRIFNWHTEDRFKNYQTREVIPSSWEEIFTEVGRLLNLKKDDDFKYQKQLMELKLIEKKLENEISQNIEKRV